MFLFIKLIFQPFNNKESFFKDASKKYFLEISLIHYEHK